jgi:hypothetical protein
VTGTLKRDAWHVGTAYAPKIVDVAMLENVPRILNPAPTATRTGVWIRAHTQIGPATHLHSTASDMRNLQMGGSQIATVKPQPQAAVVRDGKFLHLYMMPIHQPQTHHARKVQAKA